MWCRRWSPPPGERAAFGSSTSSLPISRNPNTRALYAVAVRGFFGWLDRRNPRARARIRTHHVSAYIETLTRSYKARRSSQHLAAIRMLFDLVDRRPGGRAEPGRRGARSQARRQKRARHRSSTATKAKKLIDSIDVVDDRSDCATCALIALLIYSFARISAALHMNVEDY